MKDTNNNFDVIDVYLYYYIWMHGEPMIHNMKGMLIRPKQGSNGALFVGYVKPAIDRFEVAEFEGIAKNGAVWYRNQPADGTEPGDQYTIRKAFADEIERKIFELGSRIEELKAEKEKMIDGE